MTRFFDFDGVRHPDSSANQFKFRRRNLIEGILRDFRRWTSSFLQPSTCATRWTLQVTPLDIILRTISPNASRGHAKSQGPGSQSGAGRH
jgi:hypothetical protein